MQLECSTLPFTNPGMKGFLFVAKSTEGSQCFCKGAFVVSVDERIPDCPLCVWDAYGVPPSTKVVV